MNLVEIRAVRQGRTVRLTPPYPKELIDKLSSYTLPGVWHMPAYHRRRMVRRKINGQWRMVHERVWDGKHHFLKEDTLPLGVFQGIIAEAEKQDCQLRLSSPAVHLQPPYPVVDDPQSRTYQKEAVSAMLMSLCAGQGGLVLAATGTGKTRLAGQFFRSAANEKHLFIVDELTLLHQAQEELSQAACEKVGLIGESRFEPQRITVATIQTLARHYEEANGEFAAWFQGVTVVVVDEVHVQMNRRNFSVVQKLQPSAIFGLTATLELRKKDVRLRAYALCGPVIYEYPLEAGISQGYLAPLNVILVRYPNEDLGLKYLPGYEESIVGNEDRNRLGAEIATEAIIQGHKVILLVDRIKHLERMAHLLRGFNPEVIWGGKTSSERIEAKAKFESGNSRLIITNRVFEKGIDIRSVTVGIDMAAMKSKVKAVQKLGRLARRSEGKKYALYFDIQDQGRDVKGKPGRFETAANSRRRAYHRAGLNPFVVRVRACEDGTKMFRAVVSRVEGLFGESKNGTQ